jgi:hypothetical protein
MGQYWEVGVDGSLKAYAVHQNLILNGGFEIDQQNSGSIYTNPGNGTVTLDAWTILKSGGTLPSANIQQVNRATVGAQVDTGDKSMNVVVTSAGTIDAIFAVAQEFSDYLNYVGKTISVSIRIYSSIANVVRLSVDDGVSEVFSQYHPGGSAYQTLSVTKTISTAATYLNINVLKMIAGQVTDGSYYVDSAMMVISQFPVPFAQRVADYNINGTRIAAGSINQDRVNISSFTGSGIGFNQTGQVSLFLQASPPSGWTQMVSYTDRAMRIVNGAGAGTGGSFAFSSGITLSHSHNVNGHTHSISADGTESTGGPSNVNSGWVFGSPQGSGSFESSWGVGNTIGSPGGAHTHSGPSHSHGGSTGSASPGTDSSLGTYVFQYVDIIAATKN